MNGRDPKPDNTAPSDGERREVMNGLPGAGAGDDSPYFLTFRRVLVLLVLLCLLLAAIVWWQILRGL